MMTAEMLAYYLVLTSFMAHGYFITPIVMRMLFFFQRWVYLWVFILRITSSEMEPLTKYYRLWQFRTIKTSFSWAKMLKPNSSQLVGNGKGELVSNRFGWLSLKPIR